MAVTLFVSNCLRCNHEGSRRFRNRQRRRNRRARVFAVPRHHWSLLGGSGNRKATDCYSYDGRWVSVMYAGPERRLRPRPVSRFQRLMDISFHHARKVERTSTNVLPLVDSTFLFLTSAEEERTLVLESEAPNASRSRGLQGLRERDTQQSAE